MRNFEEVIECIKIIKEKTSPNRPDCDKVRLKDGFMEVYKLSNSPTANICLEVSGITQKFQIIEKAEEIMVYILDKDGHQVNSERFKAEEDIKSLNRMKDGWKWGVEFLIKNLEELSSGI